MWRIYSVCVNTYYAVLPLILVLRLLIRRWILVRVAFTLYLRSGLLVRRDSPHMPGCVPIPDFAAQLLLRLISVGWITFHSAATALTLALPSHTLPYASTPTAALHAHPLPLPLPTAPPAFTRRYPRTPRLYAATHACL